MWQSPELEEIEVTETAYVADLNALCGMMTTLRRDGLLSREDETAIFSNVETARHP